MPLIKQDPLAGHPGTVFVRGKRADINDRILADRAFGWREDDPAYRINLRSLAHGQVIARYLKRDANGRPIVVGLLRYNALTKKV